MTIKIDKGVKMPETSTRESMYPFEDMEIGDSFFVPEKNSNQLTNSASHWRKKKGWGFTARNVHEMGKHPDTGADLPIKGARIWRTK